MAKEIEPRFIVPSSDSFPFRETSHCCCLLLSSSSSRDDIKNANLIYFILTVFFVHSLAAAPEVNECKLCAAFCLTVPNYLFTQHHFLFNSLRSFRYVSMISSFYKRIKLKLFYKMKFRNMTRRQSIHPSTRSRCSPHDQHCVLMTIITNSLFSSYFFLMRCWWLFVHLIS